MLIQKICVNVLVLSALLTSIACSDDAEPHKGVLAEACSSPSDCGDGLTCYQGDNDLLVGLCTVECYNDNAICHRFTEQSACPAAGLCVRFCDPDLNDCPPGAHCTGGGICTNGAGK